MAGRDALQAAIAAAMRRVELAEARVAGLIRAQLSATSVLWYSRDAARQLVFEEAFDEGRALKVEGLSGGTRSVSSDDQRDQRDQTDGIDQSGGMNGDEEDAHG